MSLEPAPPLRERRRFATAAPVALLPMILTIDPNDPSESPADARLNRSPPSPSASLSPGLRRSRAARTRSTWLFGRNAAPSRLPRPPAAAPRPRAAGLPPAAKAAAALPSPATTRPGDTARPRPPLRRAAPPSGMRPARAAATPRPPLRLRRRPSPSAQIVERANAYFNGMSTLIGDFVQVGGDGRQLDRQALPAAPGQDPLRIRRARHPGGRSPTAPRWRCATASSRPRTSTAIGQTPLKFLLRERIDLGQRPADHRGRARARGRPHRCSRTSRRSAAPPRSRCSSTRT